MPTTPVGSGGSGRLVGGIGCRRGRCGSSADGLGDLRVLGRLLQPHDDVPPRWPRPPPTPPPAPPARRLLGDQLGELSLDGGERGLGRGRGALGGLLGTADRCRPRLRLEKLRLESVLGGHQPVLVRLHRGGGGVDVADSGVLVLVVEGTAVLDVEENSVLSDVAGSS